MRKIMMIWCMLFVMLMVTACGDSLKSSMNQNQQTQTISIEEIPEYTGEPYVVIGDNEPDFTEEELQSDAYEFYSELDEDGKCGVAQANINKELMPTEDRENIGQVRPSGWKTVKYDNVEGKYLYNRCHLIGFQLTGENANEKNLITGTRYMNTEGMLPFENMVADYIKETGNHVMYRVTPIFDGSNLVASGVQMEARSIEDDGDGIQFNVYVYNVQPGIEIDYSTGESRLADEKDSTEDIEENHTYILNKNSKKFHLPACSGAAEIKAKNREEYKGSRTVIIQQGYEPCRKCNP